MKNIVYVLHLSAISNYKEIADIYLGIYSDLETAKQQIELFDPFKMHNRLKGAEIKSEIDDFLTSLIDDLLINKKKIIYEELAELMNYRFGVLYYFDIKKVSFNTAITSIKFKKDIFFETIGLDEWDYSIRKELIYDFSGNYTYKTSI